MKTKRQVSLTIVALALVAVFALSFALTLSFGTHDAAQAIAGDLRVFIYVDNTELSQDYAELYGYTLDFTTNWGQVNGSSNGSVQTTFTWISGTISAPATGGAVTNNGTRADFSGKQPTGTWHIGGLTQAGKITFTAKKGSDTYNQTFTYNYQAGECFAVFFTSADKTVSRTKLPVTALSGATITYDGQQHDARREGANFLLTSSNSTWSGTYTGTNAGTYPFIVTPKTQYEWPDGTTDAKYGVMTVNKADMSGLSVDFKAGKDAKPWAEDLTWTAADISVKSGSYELPTSDYTVSTQNNNDGTYTVTVQGSGTNVAGSATLTGKADRTPLSQINAELTQSLDYTFNNKPHFPNPFALSVTNAEGEELKAGDDFHIEYGENIHAGKGQIYVVFKDHPKIADGKIELTFDIKPLDISQLKFEPTAECVYSGEAQTPTFTAKIDGSDDDFSKYFDFTYYDNVNATREDNKALAKATFNGKTEDFTGVSVDIRFDIAKADLPIDAEGAIDGVQTVGALGKTLTLTSAFEADSYKWEIIDGGLGTIDSAGKSVAFTSGDREETVKVQLTVSESQNYKAGAVIAEIPVVFEEGIYIGFEGYKTKIYPTLADAVANASDGDTLYVNGEISVDESTTIDKNLTIEAHEGGDARLVRAEDFKDEFIAVNGEGIQVSISGVNFDGASLAATNSAIALTNGTLNISDCEFSNFTATNGGAVGVDGTAGGACTLTVSNSAFESNNAQKGGALYVKNGIATFDNTTFELNSAEEGGAVYFDEGGNATIGAKTTSAFTSNAATGGAGIYVAKTASVSIDNASFENNVGSEFGNGAYLVGDLSINGGDGTRQFKDTIGVADLDAVITVKQASTHRFSVSFTDEIITQIADSGKLITFVKASDGADLTAVNNNFRVSNPGYTFSSQSDGLVLGATEDVVAYVYNGSAYEKCFTFETAITKAAESAQRIVFVPITVTKADDAYTIAQAVHEITSSIVLSQAVLGKATIEFRTVIRVGDNDQTRYYIADDADKTNLGDETFNISEMAVKDLDLLTLLTGRFDGKIKATVKRGDGFTAEMLKIESGVSAQIYDVIIDGGAVWEGGSIKISDDGQGGAGTVITNNTGVTAHAPAIVNQGTLILEEGSVVTNNDNNYAAPGVGFGSHNYGGGVRNEHGGKLYANGEISYNYCREGAGIMNINRTDSVGGGKESEHPTVNIMGGKITNNVSQMKGAAVQTIYGGAKTTIGGDVSIRDNFSLNDLGSVSIEEGGSVTIEGGIISAGSGNGDGQGKNRYSVYVYNRYSQEDVTSAKTTPYVEGTKAAELIISSIPTINDEIYLDKDVICNGADLHFAPVIKLETYMGDKLTVVLSEQRGYGAIVTTDNQQDIEEANAKIDLDKLNESAVPDEASQLSLRQFIAKQDGDAWSLGYTGFDINIAQTEAGKVSVSGYADPALSNIQIKIGTKTVTLSVENGVIAAQDIDLSDQSADEDNKTNGFQAQLTADYPTGAASTQDVQAYATYGVLFVTVADGTFTAPAKAYYLAEDDSYKSLDGNKYLPNDLKLDGGVATFRFGEGGSTDIRSIQIGTRGEDIAVGEGAAPSLYDITKSGESYTLTANGKDGFEYALFDKDGNMVSDWAKCTDGIITFDSIQPATEANATYTLKVRRASAEGLLPGKYSDDQVCAFTSPTAAQLDLKDAHDSAFATAKSAGISQYTFGMTVAEYVENLNTEGIDISALQEAYETAASAYEALPQEMKDLPAVAAQYEALEMTRKVLTIAEWENLYQTSKSDNHATKSNVKLALDAYKDLVEEGKTLVVDKYAELLAAYKTLTTAELGAYKAEAIEKGGDETALNDIQTNYAALINDARDKFKENVAEDDGKGNYQSYAADDIDAYLARAKAAMDLRVAYDDIVKQYTQQLAPFYTDSEDLVSAFEATLAGDLADGYDNIGKANAADIESASIAAQKQLQKDFAKAAIDSASVAIMSNAAENGFAEELIKAFGGADENGGYTTLNAYKAEYDEIEETDFEQFKTAVGDKLAEHIKAMEITEATAQVYSEFPKDEIDGNPAMAEKFTAFFGENGKGGEADGYAGRTTADEKSTLQTKTDELILSLNKERAKQFIADALDELKTKIGAEAESDPHFTQAQATAGEYSGKIDSAASADDAFLQARIACAIIQKEFARLELLQNINSDDSNKNDKADIVAKYFDDAYSLDDEAEAKSLNDRISAIVDSSDSPADKPEKISDEIAKATAAAEKELAEYDRTYFMNADGTYSERPSIMQDSAGFTFNGKKTEEIGASDLADIDGALDFLSDNFSATSQLEMNDLRNDLLLKKVQAAKASIPQTASESATALADKYKKLIDDAVATLDNGYGDWTENTFDAGISEQLSETLDDALKALALQAAKDEDIAALEKFIKNADGSDKAVSAALKQFVEDAIAAINAIAYDDNAGTMAAEDGKTNQAELDQKLQQLDDLAEELLANAKLKEQKDSAKADFVASYKAVYGADKTADDIAADNDFKDVLSGIDSKETLSDINDALAEATKKLLDKLTTEFGGGKDSDATEALVANAKTAVDSGKTTANTNGEVASFLQDVKNCKTGVEAKRYDEKLTAKQGTQQGGNSIQQQLDAFNATPGITQEAKSKAQALADEAKAAIDDGQYDDYAFYQKRFADMLDLLKYADEFAAKRTQGVPADEVYAERDKALAELGNITPSADTGKNDTDCAGDEHTKQEARSAAVDKGRKNMYRSFAIAELNGVMKDGDSDFVQSVVENAKQQVNGATQDGKTAEEYERELDGMIEDCKNRAEAERFKDDHPVLRDKTKGGKDDLAAAATDYDDLPSDVQSVLDAEASNDTPYDGFKDMIADKVKEADFEDAKQAKKDALEAKLNACDGDYVREALAQNLADIDSVEYEPHSEADRQQYYDQLIAQLNAKADSASENIDYAIYQQQKMAQLDANVAAKQAGGRYNDNQKAQLNDIVDRAKSDIMAITPSTAGGVDEAKAAVDSVFDEAVESLDDVQVCRVDAAEDQDGAQNEGGSIVSEGDEGFDPFAQLKIDRKSDDGMKTIEQAMKAGKVHAAAGNDISPEEVKQLLDGKKVARTFDVYLELDGVRVNVESGTYTITLKLKDLGDITNPQIVYIDKDGGVEVFKTDYVYDDSGKAYAIRFTTTHLSDFYLLSEPTLDLTWLIILLSVILFVEIVGIIVLLAKRKSDKDDEDEQQGEQDGKQPGDEQKGASSQTEQAPQDGQSEGDEQKGEAEA